jgi:DNA-binding beta-propeller fold protein YncE/mono/diheme cytochrome c family protein
VLSTVPLNGLDRLSSRRIATRCGAFLAATFLFLCAAAQPITAENRPTDTPPATAATASAGLLRLRYPVALAAADKGKLLLAANERSGTVSIVDIPGRKVIGEFPVGKHLSDLVAVPGVENAASEAFLCADSAADELKLLFRRGNEIAVGDSLSVGSFPVSVCVDSEGRRGYVASLWSRRLTRVDLVRDGTGTIHLKAASVVALPFPPRLQTLTPDGKRLIVAGAFGGEMAVVDPAASKLEAVKTIPGQNIHGLAWSRNGERLFVAQQTLNRLGYTSQEDLHWGSVVSNVVRSLDRHALEQPNVDVLAGSQVIQLGEVANGAGDPAGLSVADDGTLLVALAGVGEVACGSFETGHFRRLAVGIRPTTLITSADRSSLYVADTFGDSIAVIPHSAFETPGEAKAIVQIALGPQPSLSAAERGERLFFDARLSLEKWMSCHSCHSEGHSSDALSDTLGDGSFGAAKRIPGLGGVAETGPWAWNGSIKNLGEQVRKSLKTTMRVKFIDDAQVSDLTAYLRTLKPAPPLTAAPSAAEKSAIERGHAVFARQKCDRCHVPPTFTSPRLYDVGLRDELGNRQFNPPSLRGVGQRAAFFHDGRATSLRDVFAVHRHPGNTQLPDADLADLIAFLQSV